MRPLVVSALSISLVALTSVAFAQAPASDQDHAAHHPAGASAPASGVKTPGFSWSGFISTVVVMFVWAFLAGAFFAWLRQRLG